MPDDPEPGSMPSDPFTPDHMGFVAMLHMFRGLRAAGASMAEAAVIVGGIVSAGGEGPKPDA